MPHREIREILRNQTLLTAPPAMAVREAAEKMAGRHVAAIVVAEQDGHLDGIFTERDLLERVVARGLDPRTTSLADVMTARPAAVTPGQTVRDALHVMDAKGIRHLPVEDCGRVVGIVSMRDFVSDEVAELEFEHEVETQLAERMW